MQSSDGGNPDQAAMNMPIKMDLDGMGSASGSQQQQMNQSGSGPGPIRVQMVQHHQHPSQSVPYPNPNQPVRFLNRGPIGPPSQNPNQATTRDYLMQQQGYPPRLGVHPSQVSPPNPMHHGGSPMGQGPMGPPSTSLSQQLAQPPSLPPSFKGLSPDSNPQMLYVKQEPSTMSPMPPPTQQMPDEPIPQAMEPQPGPVGPPQGPNIMPPGTEGVLLDKSRLDELSKQIDSNLVLEDAVKEALVDITEEFVDDLIDKMCSLMRMRNSDRFSVRDLELVLDLAYKMPVAPRASVHIYNQPPTIFPKADTLAPSEAHKQRMAFIRRDIKKL
ncbi:hypothetical protein WR25_14296 [Diploscapter pachys]|uniref:Transcription initiation factor TFIID subunit 12 n=1 Tax=Diploscapter pachys TaxID=2018661 RepID=A0A2A2KGZ1_9BILA|nr:hypothetical protein WR25_14296 [Diploscapter pachys]